MGVVTVVFGWRSYVDNPDRHAAEEPVVAAAAPTVDAPDSTAGTRIAVVVRVVVVSDEVALAALAPAVPPNV